MPAAIAGVSHRLGTTGGNAQTALSSIRTPRAVYERVIDRSTTKCLNAQ